MLNRLCGKSMHPKHSSKPYRYRQKPSREEAGNERKVDFFRAGGSGRTDRKKRERLAPAGFKSNLMLTSSPAG